MSTVKGAYFAEADSAYIKGEYQKASELYEDGIRLNGVSPEVLYNLGNTYLKLGKEGEARICYERALRLDPGNKTIASNLSFLEAKVNEANKGGQKEGNSLEPDELTAMQTLYKIIAVDRRSDSWGALAVMAFILFLGGLALYVFTPKVLARKTGFFSGIVFLFFSIVFLIFSIMAARRFETHDEAVLKTFSTELFQQPEAMSKPCCGPLYKGTKMKILEERKGKDGNEWLKVKVNSDNEGWIKLDDVEII